jgi:hypothetical protein
MGKNIKIKKKKSTSLGEKVSLSERYVSTFFAIYSRKQKSKIDFGRSSDLLPYLNAFPFSKKTIILFRKKVAKV